MMYRTQKIMCILALLVLVPGTSWGAMKLTVSREDNSYEDKWSPGTADENQRVLINKIDCSENILVYLEVEEIPSNSDRELYLFAGDDCGQTDSDSCVWIATLESNAGYSDFYVYKERFRGLIEGEEAGVETCNLDTTIKVWAGFLEDNSADATGDWSNAVEFDMDMASPDTPTGLKPAPGEANVVLDWDMEGVDDTTEGDAGTGSSGSGDQYIVIYMEASGGAAQVDGGTDGDAGSDTDTDTDTGDMDAGADAGDAGGQDTDSSDEAIPDAGNNVPGWRLYGATEGSEECPSSEGFQAGDEYVPGSYSENTSSITEAKIGNLTNGTTYRFAVIAVDEHKNFSPVSEVVCAIPNETVDFFEAYAGAGGAGGKFCFVATAAFGSYDHPTVKVLRHFRDKFLEPLPGGQALVAAYYDLGPAAASVVEDAETLRGVTRGALILFAGMTRPLSALGPKGAAGVGLLALGAVAFGIVITRRRKTRG